LLQAVFIVVHRGQAGNFVINHSSTLLLQHTVYKVLQKKAFSQEL
jgi:hypothetical protein